MLPIVFAALALTACEKASPSNNGSGALTAKEGELLAHLPPGGNIVFGGSLYNMQQRMQESALGRAQAKLADPALTAWNTCLAGKNMEMVGTATFADGELGIRVYIRGVTLPEMQTCAQTANLPLTSDPDGKFITVETTQQGTTAKTPYLAVAGGVYGLVSMGGLGELALGGKPTLKEVSRAELEAEVASLSKGTAATDPTITALLTKVDRRKMMWFAGSAAGTPLADKVVQGYGSFSIDNGIAVDVTVQPADPADGDRALSQFSKMKSQLGQMPANMGALKDAIRAIKLSRVGPAIRMQLSLTDQQIDEIMKVAGPMMPGM